MLRILLVCLVLPACFDAEDDEDEYDPPPAVTEAIFTVTAPQAFDTLLMIEPDQRETLAVSPPSAEYVWDDTHTLPASMQVVAFRNDVMVAYANQSFTYRIDQVPNGTFTIELHP